jgi:hypothetical protein
MLDYLESTSFYNIFIPNVLTPRVQVPLKRNVRRFDLSHQWRRARSARSLDPRDASGPGIIIFSPPCRSALRFRMFRLSPESSAEFSLVSFLLSDQPSPFYGISPSRSCRTVRAGRVREAALDPTPMAGAKSAHQNSAACMRKRQARRWSPFDGRSATRLRRRFSC